MSWTTDFYKEVPRTLLANLEYRLKIRERARRDKQFRIDLLEACKWDIMFWLGTFCFVYEPRPKYSAIPRLPFIPWPHQEPVITAIRENIGYRDIVIKKARGEGMSWIGVMMALHDWLFFPMRKIGLVSSTELKSDDPGNLDSLGAKLDLQLQYMPRWMAGIEKEHYQRSKSDHYWWNLRNGSQINAFAATSETGRAGRYTWFMPDELASWARPKDQEFMDAIQHSTDSRLVISTPNGTDGAYYKIVHKRTPTSLHLTLSWMDNPVRNRGMYRIEKYKPVAIDPVNNPLPPGYEQQFEDLAGAMREHGFRVDGSKLRSPWYDQECLRAGSPRAIAMDLDMDFGGTLEKFFHMECLDRMSATCLHAPTLAKIQVHTDDLEMTLDLPEDPKGDVLKLWCPLDHKKKPPLRQYAMGIDVGRGEGGVLSSNSAVVVVDLLTMEQVAEFTSNTMDPGDFADLCMALAKYFNYAFMAWEVNGPGKPFTTRVIERKYQNVYVREIPWKKRRHERITKDIGWHTGKETKYILLDEFRRAITTKKLIIRSFDVLKECQEYHWENGQIVHVHAVKADDDPDTGEAHGDRVIASCVCYQAIKTRPAIPREQRDEMIHAADSCVGERYREWERAQMERDDDWDDRTNYELATGRAGMWLGD